MMIASVYDKEDNFICETHVVHIWIHKETVYAATGIGNFYKGINWFGGEFYKEASDRQISALSRSGAMFIYEIREKLYDFTYPKNFININFGKSVQG